MIEADLKTSIVLNREFSDFDEFSEFVNLWDLDFRQLDSGDFKTNITQIASSNFQLMKSDFNRKLDQKGSAPKGLVTFALLANESTSVMWRGEKADPHKIVIFPQDGELEAFSDPGFNVYTFSYHEDLLYNVAETLGVTLDKDALRQAKVKDSNPHILNLLRQTISSVLDNIKLKSPHMERDQIKYELEYEIPRSILLSLRSGNQLEDTPSPKNRYSAIRRIREYLDSNKVDNITVRDLCKIGYVSERTLRYAFEEIMGISPSRFVKVFRLNRVRRDLLRTKSSDKSIFDCAYKWGFRHMGQFSADYCSLFGELPSETARIK